LKVLLEVVPLYVTNGSEKPTALLAASVLK